MHILFFLNENKDVLRILQGDVRDKEWSEKGVKAYFVNYM